MTKSGELKITISNGNTDHLEDSTKEAKEAKEAWFKEMRSGIMVVAVLVAGATYTAGLSPPGGFWQDDQHNAGTAILHDKYYNRYITFFYANATAFMASLVIIILLMNETFYTNFRKVFLLDVIMVLDMVSLMVAYAAGCARSVRTSIYVCVLAVVVLLVVLYSAEKLHLICMVVTKIFPRCLHGLPDQPTRIMSGVNHHRSCQCVEIRENA